MEIERGTMCTLMFTLLCARCLVDMLLLSACPISLLLLPSPCFINVMYGAVRLLHRCMQEWLQGNFSFWRAKCQQIWIEAEHFVRKKQTTKNRHLWRRRRYVPHYVCVCVCVCVFEKERRGRWKTIARNVIVSCNSTTNTNVNFDDLFGTP